MDRRGASGIFGADVPVMLRSTSWQKPSLSYMKYAGPLDSLIARRRFRAS